jgi:iron complex outermembrane receptor protein
MSNRTPSSGSLFGRAFSLWCILSALLFTFSATADTSTNQIPNYADMDLEKLMNIPVIITASKYEQKATEAPSSVTVVTSEEIKRYGYRTLAEILASVQGFYVTYDRNYAFLGASGINLGDFNSRILLLINGHRINSDLNDSAYIDSTFILDVDLIDHVEIIRGPGSVLYGNNAFFGVVNVITREGNQVDGVESSGSYGTFNAYTGRVTVGSQWTNGLRLMLSGTVYGSDGAENLFYPQFNTPAQNNGIAHDLDDGGSGSFFGSVGYKDFTLEGAFVDRQKGNPTAQYDTTFNDPRLRTDDDRSYVTVKYAHQFEGDWDALADVYYDRADFEIHYPEVPLLFEEQQSGEWAGGEVQFDKRICDRHILTLGAEYRDDFRQDRRVFEPATGTVFTDVHESRRNYGVFGQGQFAVLTNLHLNTGVRYDQYGHFDPSFSPRAALIYDPFGQTTLKFIYGMAFRDPNFLELSDPRFQDIQPEKITSYNLVYEQGIGPNLRSSISGYYNQMDDLINFQNGSFTNFNADTLALELALEGKWANGIQTRMSYTLQHTRNLDSAMELPDSPMHLVKFNASAPLWQDKIYAGLEVLYTSQRHTVFTDLSGETLPGPDVPGYAVVNLTLLSRNIVKNLEFSASIYNLFDNTYDDPSSRFHLQNAIQQDGRTFRVKLTYRF